jgi:sialic acid synthase SpsE
MKRHIQLRSGCRIGQGSPCFVVAEIGNNHQGDMDMARRMVREAAACGVQAVKFQKRDVRSLLTVEGYRKPYTGRNSFGPTYGEHREALELSIAEMAELKALAEDLGLVFFASAWDMRSLEEMFGLGVELVKICSADLVNLPMLRRIGLSDVPAILSTGMSTLAEVDRAVHELTEYTDDLVILHCNSSYPCPEEEIALPVIEQLRSRYRLPVGYSGHEAGIAPSVAAVALGACVVERHFTLDRTLPGTDHQASLDPAGMRQLVSMVREVERAMGVCAKRVTEAERNSSSKLRKSIVASRYLPAGTVLDESCLTLKCPGTGLSPLNWDDLLGLELLVDVAADQQMDFSMAAKSSRVCEGM